MIIKPFDNNFSWLTTKVPQKGNIRSRLNRKSWWGHFGHSPFFPPRVELRLNFTEEGISVVWFISYSIYVVYTIPVANKVSAVDTSESILSEQADWWRQASNCTVKHYAKFCMQYKHKYKVARACWLHEDTEISDAVWMEIWLLLQLFVDFYLYHATVQKKEESLTMHVTWKCHPSLARKLTLNDKACIFSPGTFSK